jgi:hypothetical protein
MLSHFPPRLRPAALRKRPHSKATVLPSTDERQRHWLPLTSAAPLRARRRRPVQGPMATGPSQLLSRQARRRTSPRLLLPLQQMQLLSGLLSPPALPRRLASSSSL